LHSIAYGVIRRRLKAVLLTSTTLIVGGQRAYLRQMPRQIGERQYFISRLTGVDMWLRQKPTLLGIMVVVVCLNACADATAPRKITAHGSDGTCYVNQASRQVVGAHLIPTSSGLVHAGVYAPAGLVHPVADDGLICTDLGGGDMGDDNGVPVDFGGAYGPGYGNDYGDGNDFVGWNYIDPASEDGMDAASAAEELCPNCTPQILAAVIISASQDPTQAITELPAVETEAEAEAAELGESLTGWWARTVANARDMVNNVQATIHHIATNKNFIAGNQWSVRFKALFERMGLSLNGSYNTVEVIDHVGPHPDLYHQNIFDRLNAAA
jgi:hypothetical protein